MSVSRSASTRPARAALLPALLPALVLTLAAAGPAAGAEPPPPLWELGAGATVLRMPHYRGAEQSRTWVLPIPYAVYRGEILRADREGARAVLLDRGRVELDLSVAASAPTRDGENRARAGMPALEPTVEFGPNLKIDLARHGDLRVVLHLPVRAAFALGTTWRHAGWAASPHLALDGAAGAWDFGLRAGALWGDRRLHGLFYDVDPAYATATRPAYQARGGSAGHQFTVGGSRRLGPFWVGAFWRLDSVAGAAFEPSPLVRRQHNRMFGVGVSWIFATSSQPAPHID
ncbi:MAG: MipA/OmpV family protein [Rubrivivax sp.]|nr:MipA/OmpV family protein [Rubrivivax sp.]